MEGLYESERYPLSVLFNIYFDKLFRTLNDGIPSDIKLNNCTALNTLLFADDMAVIQAKITPVSYTHLNWFISIWYFAVD